MKVIRAYGGKVFLSCYGGGWGFEYQRNRVFNPPRRTALTTADGKAIYNFRDGQHGYGTAETLREARRHGVNALKN